MSLRSIVWICVFALGILNLSGCGCNATKDGDNTATTTAASEDQEKERERAQTPVFVLASGSYEGDQQITIDASEADAVYYTLDGSEPESDDTRYEGPFTLEPGRYTVRAVAVNPAGQESPIVEAQYDIKSVAEPEVESEDTTLIDSIQGLWGYQDHEYNNVLIYSFEGNILKVGYLQSEWQGPYVFEVIEESSSGGLIRMQDITMDCRIDYGTPGDNKISLVRITPEESFPAVTLLYLSADEGIFNNPDGPDAIRKKIAAMDNAV